MIHKGEKTMLCEPHSVVSNVLSTCSFPFFEISCCMIAHGYPSQTLTNIINVSLLELDSTLIIVTTLITTLCLLVDGEVGFEFSVRFQITCFIRGVFVDDICSLVLEFSEREKNDIAGGDPDLGSVLAPRHQEQRGVSKGGRKRVVWVEEQHGRMRGLTFLRI